MAEPEDLILEGAHAASRLARHLWRRYAASAPGAAVLLPDVRVQIELFLHALFGRWVVVAGADPPAPASWLARLAELAARGESLPSHRDGRGAPPARRDDREYREYLREEQRSWRGRIARRMQPGFHHGRLGPRARPDEVFPGTDGVRIYLPRVLDAGAGVPAAIETYLLLAVQQSVRLIRGSAAVALEIQDNEIRDRFRLADADAVDRWIAREAPGLVPALLLARRAALARGAGPFSGAPRERVVGARVRALLVHDPFSLLPDLPRDESVADALEWARASAAAEPGAGPYRGIVTPWYWGCPILRSSNAVRPSLQTEDETSGPHPRSRQRVAEMRRRPRVRQGAEDEDDHGSGAWIIRADEPQESIEDPFGLQRPTDRDDNADPEGLGDSLSELPEARVVRTPGQAREVLRAGEEEPRTGGARPTKPAGVGIAYPEWDFQAGAYRQPGAIVREIVPLLGDAAWVAAVCARHAGLVRRVRSRFERLRPRRTRVDRQPDGPELDIAAYVTAAADRRAGLRGPTEHRWRPASAGPLGTVSEDRFYVAMRPVRRELAVALLVDVSASTDAWVSGQQRIVDVEKEALLVVCDALDALGDRYAIFAFAGEGPEHVSIVPVKGFAERTSGHVRQRIAALEADGYTRLGAAVRHATAALCRERAERRLLLILSDGKPNDVDAYEGRYGVEDARQAVAECKVQDVHVFCLTVDREAAQYAPRIFGRAGFTLLRHPGQLPVALIEVLRRLIRP